MNVQQVSSIMYSLYTKGIRHQIDFNERTMSFNMFIVCRTPEQFAEVYDIVSYVDYVSVAGSEEDFTLICENGTIKLEKWWTA